jgi:uncharacterized protein YnzC (UPF0291/DUF896 family)
MYTQVKHVTDGLNHLRTRKAKKTGGLQEDDQERRKFFRKIYIFIYTFVLNEYVFLCIIVYILNVI